MPVIIKANSGGGSVTLDAGAAAADTTLTLPNVTGTVLQSGTAVTVAQGGTGAATLTANAVLIGNGTSAVTAVAPSTAGNVLTSTGSAWASTAPTSTGINVQNFTSSGTWTKPSLSASSRVLIQAWGGGGSGSKAASNGSGGGGGGYNERWLSLSAMGATETITIGAGGTAVTTTSSGNNGGNSSAGSLITAYAGAGGASGGVAGGGPLGAANGTVAGSPLILAGLDTNTCGGFVTQVNKFYVGQASYPGVLHGGGSSTSSVWGGGGGGTNSGTSSGAGGAGQIIITVFPA